MGYWWGTFYRHIADRTRLFWWMNAIFAASIGVIVLVVGLAEDDGAQQAQNFMSVRVLGILAVVFVVGGLLTPRERR